MPISDEDARQRVKVIRLAFCERDQAGKPEPAKDFAKRLGVEPTTWNNFEKQGRPGLDNAVRLVETFEGLTLDFLYLGDKSSLSVAMQRDLARAEKEAGSQESPTRSVRTKVRAGRAARSVRSPSNKASTISRA